MKIMKKLKKIVQKKAKNSKKNSMEKIKFKKSSQIPPPRANAIFVPFNKTYLLLGFFFLKLSPIIITKIQVELLVSLNSLISGLFQSPIHQNQTGSLLPSKRGFQSFPHA
jgi:hypothetical protein